MVRVHPRDHSFSFNVLYGYDQVIRKLYGGDDVDFETALMRYERHFSQLMPTDPRVRFIERFPSRPLSCRLEISETELHASQSYRDLLDGADVEYSLVVSLPEDDGSLIMVGVFRGKQSTFFEEHEVEAFGELIPHVKQAVALSEHLSRLDFANRLALEALDSLAIGVLIVDENARLVHANAAAGRVLDMADGITQINGMLRLAASKEDSTIRGAVWDAITKVRGGEMHAGVALAISRPSGSEPFSALVTTLWGNRLRFGVGRLDRPLAVVYLTIPEEPQETSAELLRRLLGLTLAEARLCERLVLGRTLKEGAEDLAITTGTARQHLKAVFRKTGVKRQAELVAKILATPLWLRHRHEADGPKGARSPER